jgi:hypothetical protein
MTEQPQAPAIDEQPTPPDGGAGESTGLDDPAPAEDLTNPDHAEDGDADALAGEELEDDGLDDEADGDDTNG